MKQKSTFLLLIVGILILSACENENSVKDEVEEKAEVEKEVADFDIEEELAWMEEMNGDIIDSGVYLLNREEEPIGPTISYSLMKDDSDTEARYKLYGSFNGERYEFEMGYYAPDSHSIQITSVKEKERENKQITLPHEDLFEEFYEDNTSFFKEDSKWQITLSDVTGNGVDELIKIARYNNLPGEMPKTIVAIYEYTNDQDEPFKLAANFSFEMVASYDVPEVYFTDGKEFVHRDDGNQQDVISAYYEDGEWFVRQDMKYLNLANAKSFHYDDHDEIVELKDDELHKIQLDSLVLDLHDIDENLVYEKIGKYISIYYLDETILKKYVPVGELEEVSEGEISENASLIYYNEENDAAYQYTPSGDLDLYMILGEEVNQETKDAYDNYYMSYQSVFNKLLENDFISSEIVIDQESVYDIEDYEFNFAEDIYEEIEEWHDDFQYIVTGDLEEDERNKRLNELENEVLEAFPEFRQMPWPNQEIAHNLITPIEYLKEITNVVYISREVEDKYDEAMLLIIGQFLEVVENQLNEIQNNM